MDLRQYYAAVKLIEDQISGPDVFVVSEATRDGGKAGVLSEVSRHAGARLIVERKARLATAEERDAYRERQHVSTTDIPTPVAVSDVAATTTKPSGAPRARKS